MPFCKVNFVLRSVVLVYKNHSHKKFLRKRVSLYFSGLQYFAMCTTAQKKLIFTHFNIKFHVKQFINIQTAMCIDGQIYGIVESCWEKKCEQKGGINWSLTVHKIRFIFREYANAKRPLRGIIWFIWKKLKDLSNNQIWI